jgi:hypothetical protein
MTRRDLRELAFDVILLFGLLGSIAWVAGAIWSLMR